MEFTARQLEILRELVEARMVEYNEKLESPASMSELALFQDAVDELIAIQEILEATKGGRRANRKSRKANRKNRKTRKH